MKAIFQVNTPGRAYAWLLTFGLARTVLDFFWVPQNSQPLYMVLTLFNTTTYQFTLYLFIPWIAGFILERLFARPVDHAGVLRNSVLVWLVYPAVSIISMALKSPPTQTIEWFRYIPTFMVDYNFLPAGMIAVTPVLIIVYTRLFIRHSGATWPTALISVVWALLIQYVIYYHYIALLFLFLLFRYGPIFAIGFYNLTCLLPLLPLAKRFHQAFGPYPFSLPRLVPIWSLVSAGLMLGALPTVLSPGPPPGPPPVASQRTTQWSLRMFQLYDQADTLSAYGFYLESDGAGRPVRVFRLFQPGSFFIPNLELLRSDAKKLAYGALLDIRIGNPALDFKWNRGPHGKDAFLESFVGTDIIVSCDASLADVRYRCFLLDENISADVSKIGSWTGETFMAASGKDLSLVAFAYDNYVDGTIAIGNDRRSVEAVSRRDWTINITFEGGQAVANCIPAATYETLGGSDPQPLESPVRCDVIVEMDGNHRLDTRVDGIVEWISETQGSPR